MTDRQGVDMTRKQNPNENLIAYAAGELSGTDAATVEARLRSDPRAAATVARYRLAH